MIRKLGCVAGLVMAASTVACDPSPLSPGELRLLTAAEARWAARPFQNYSVEIREGCFCPPIMTQWARVEVIGGSISRVVLVESGAEVGATERTYFRTVEGAFAAIRSARSDSWVEDIVAEFDPQLGFPTFVNFVAKRNIIDGGGAIYLRNATALPGP
jgi:Family of unknown function (DUF6174)